MMFKAKTKRVAILGCGPAGMFATHAFAEAGWEVTVYSKKRPSQMFGAQYLHEPIPGLPERQTVIDYQLRGTRDGYVTKVYGALPLGQSSSVDMFVGKAKAWDIREAYYAAYEKYEHFIVDTDIQPGWLELEFSNPGATSYWRKVVSTIPAPQNCLRPESRGGAHQFNAQKVWAAGDAPELDRWSPITAPKDTVICNGDMDFAWYRCSNIFGHNTAEWPYDRRPPIEGVAEVVKPIGTNCDCHPQIDRLGRYGAWLKGILANNAYHAAAAMARKG